MTSRSPSLFISGCVGIVSAAGLMTILVVINGRLHPSVWAIAAGSGAIAGMASGYNHARTRNGTVANRLPEGDRGASDLPFIPQIPQEAVEDLSQNSAFWDSVGQYKIAALAIAQLTSTEESRRVVARYPQVAQQVEDLLNNAVQPTPSIPPKTTIQPPFTGAVPTATISSPEDPAQLWNQELNEGNWKEFWSSSNDGDGDLQYADRRDEPVKLIDL